MTATVAFMGADHGAYGGKRIVGKQHFRGFPFLSSSTSFIMSGTGVDTGQFFLHWGTLHFKQRAAIS